MSTLDMDVIFVDILPRLPAKSLARFKCISKSFKSTILSRNLLVLPGGHGLKCYDLNSPASAIAISTFVWDERCSIFVVGSFNGLLCILTEGGVRYMYVLNPSTRICKHINLKELGFFVFNFNFGFGFDHLNLDYKIMAVVDQHDESNTITRITWVYSLNTNSWQMVETESPTDSMEKRNGGVLIRNNLLHWMFWSPSLRKRRIGCFDVCKMKWADDVLLPRYYYDPDHKNYLLEIGVFDDRLFSSFENHVDSCFDLWVMKVYGVQDSWIKLFSIPVSNDLGGGVMPVACRERSGDILIRQRHSSRLLWYNRMNGRIMKAKFHRSPIFSNLQVYTYSKSIVDIPDGKLFRDTLEFPGEIIEEL